MIVNAPMRKEELDALECELQKHIPTKIRSDLQEEFTEQIKKTTSSFRTLNDAPYAYLTTIAELRKFYSRLDPWQPTYELLATARGESTQGLYRALRYREDFLTFGLTGGYPPLYTDSGKLLPIVHRLDRPVKANGSDSEEPSIDEKAASAIDFMLAGRGDSTSPEDIASRVKTIVDSQFQGQSADAVAEREEFLRLLVADYGYDIRLRE